MDPSLLPDSSFPALFSWLEARGGVAGALLVLALWTSTLLRERTGFHRRIEQLSDALCRSIESGSAERARLSDEYRLGHDWTVRCLLDAFTQLATTREHSASATPPPKRPQPPPARPTATGAASDVIPPPLPPQPPPKRRA